jgi:hypothetical protein
VEVTQQSGPRRPPAAPQPRRRGYQAEALREFIETALRFWALLWERQSGKSTTIAEMCLYEMLRRRGRTCIYGSASLLLGSEIPLKISQRLDYSRAELVSKDAHLLSDWSALASARVAEKGLLFQVADGETGKIVKGLTPDDFVEMFEGQRLEFRVYHDKSVYSRTKVIAPNVATARSWSGTVFLDEVAFIRALRELITALLPVISTNAEFKLILATTPPEFDDTHYSFELLAPPPGTEFTPNPAGNWYESESGVRVHRADAFDTHAAGKKIFDLKSGLAISPQEAFRRAPNKDGHRIAHWLWWTIGGAAACDLLRLKVAQERGVGVCSTFHIDNDTDLAGALNWLELHLDPRAPIALGLDKGTTTKQKSNPTVLALMEEHGPEVITRCQFIWKTRDPDLANERLERVLRVIEGRPAGGRARALAIDATSERYDAESQRKLFRARLPVLLIVGSEGVEKPGLDKPTNWKEYSSSQYIGKLDDNHLTLPADVYTRVDHRLVMRDRGKFVCEPDEEGRHGDTFDAGRLALVALTERTGLSTCDGIIIGEPKGRRR